MSIFGDKHFEFVRFRAESPPLRMPYARRRLDRRFLGTNRIEVALDLGHSELGVLPNFFEALGKFETKNNPA